MERQERKNTSLNHSSHQALLGPNKSELSMKSSELSGIGWPVTVGGPRRRPRAPGRVAGHQALHRGHIKKGPR